VESDGTIDERLVVGIIAIALLLGIALYNIVPLGSSGSADSRDALVATTTTTTAAPQTSGGSGTTSGGVDLGSGGGLFGSGAGALVDGTTADAGTGSNVDIPETPTVPEPVCPTSVASDAYEQVADPVSAALGQSIPRDNVRVLAEIAAGCSNESPGDPVVGLALDLARLVPPTGVPPVGLGVVPPISAPTIPPAVIDALGPLADPIREGCANVGLLGVLAAVIPGAASIPVYGSDLAKVLVPAQTLCAQFER
jgi:hypothetical protein